MSLTMYIPYNSFCLPITSLPAENWPQKSWGLGLFSQVWTVRCQGRDWSFQCLACVFTLRIDLQHLIGISFCRHSSSNTMPSLLLRGLESKRARLSLAHEVENDRLDAIEHARKEFGDKARHYRYLLEKTVNLSSNGVDRVTEDVLRELVGLVDWFMVLTGASDTFTMV